jgi:hypothetical protein
LNSAHCTTDESTDIAPLRVLLVCARCEYVGIVRDIARRWGRPAHIQWTADPTEALRMAAENPPALAIVDARVDRASGCSLIPDLEQLCRGIDVLAFDERCVPAPLSQRSTWHWPELPRAVTWWVERYARPRPALR